MALSAMAITNNCSTETEGCWKPPPLSPFVSTRSLFFVFFLNVDESDERVSTFSRRGVALSLSLAVILSLLLFKRERATTTFPEEEVEEEEEEEERFWLIRTTTPLDDDSH